MPQGIMQRKTRWLTKNKYECMIWEYESRREKLRQKYPDWRRGNEAYNRRAEVLSYKIRLWKHMVKLIEEREANIRAHAEDVCDFLGIPKSKGRYKPLGNCARDRSKALARKLFYKYCLEDGIYSPYVAMWVGCNSVIPGTSRLKFTRSFQTHPENREMWYRFKNYLKNKERVTVSSFPMCEAA